MMTDIGGALSKTGFVNSLPFYALEHWRFGRLLPFYYKNFVCLKMFKRNKAQKYPIKIWKKSVLSLGEWEPMIFRIKDRTITWYPTKVSINFEKKNLGFKKHTRRNGSY
jgi:hypothetical protein